MTFWEVTYSPINDDLNQLSTDLTNYGALSITISESPPKLTALFNWNPTSEDWALSASIKQLNPSDWEQSDTVRIEGLTIQRLTTVFGTDHPTSNISLNLLRHIQTELTNTCRALDVGTGTGLLSLWFLKYIGQTITSIDIDPNAIDLAKINAETNQLSSNGFSIADISNFESSSPYNLVMANIPTELHTTLSTRIKSLLTPNGSLLLSGFTSRNQEYVLTPYYSLGFQIKHSYAIDDWLGFILS